jgi:hypothetical protein
MTERGTRVRWSTAALVAPAAAALFTGTTVWAAGHEPATASTPTASTASPAPTVDPLVVALRAAIDKNTAQVDRLRKTVAALQARAAAIAKGTAVPKSSSSRPTSSTRTSTRTSTSTATRSTTRTTTAAPAPAPAPATQTTTGASGAVK